MAIIQRRVFYGKVGAAEDLVAWANEMYSVIRVNSPAISHRVLSDYQSGQTDRVVVEIEVENMAQIDEALGKTMADPNTQKQFADVFSRLGSLIDRAEVEQWTIH
ncbi:MAG: hypothetical protein QF554_08895 [Dehalococcoidia bacterium]|jgi:hypothetical protein|nr:hypothetical protein [Dehalococcoidia bacterium]